MLVVSKEKDAVLKSVLVRGEAVRGVGVTGEGALVHHTWPAVAARRSRPPPETLAVRDAVRVWGGRVGCVAPWEDGDMTRMGHGGSDGAWPSSGDTCRRRENNVRVLWN